MGETIHALTIAAAIAAVPMLAYIIVVLLRHAFSTDRPGFAAGSPEARELLLLRERVDRLERSLAAAAAEAGHADEALLAPPSLGAPFGGASSPAHGDRPTDPLGIRDTAPAAPAADARPWRAS